MYKWRSNSVATINSKCKEHGNEKMLRRTEEAKKAKKARKARKAPGFMDTPPETMLISILNLYEFYDIDMINEFVFLRRMTCHLQLKFGCSYEIDNPIHPSWGTQNSHIFLSCYVQRGKIAGIETEDFCKCRWASDCGAFLVHFLMSKGLRNCEMCAVWAV